MKAIIFLVVLILTCSAVFAAVEIMRDPDTGLPCMVSNNRPLPTTATGTYSPSRSASTTHYLLDSVATKTEIVSMSNRKSLSVWTSSGTFCFTAGTTTIDLMTPPVSNFSDDDFPASLPFVIQASPSADVPIGVYQKGF